MMERPRFLKTWAEPPRRPGFALRTVLVLALILGMLFTVVESWLVATSAPGLRTGPRVVEIPSHRGLFEVARLLDEAGVIRSPVGFSLLAVLRGSARSLKAGEYQIPRGASTFSVLWLLEGGYVLQHNIVFQEGATVAELGRQLETERLARAEDMTAEEILARMVARMREKLSPEVLEQARARDLSLHQLLTLASIIEKEAVDPTEMPLISAVFWNRLKREMPLQADPTVQYALGKDRLRLSREDLSVDSPFNTYRRTGLPPGPIASPGRLAIQAAVRPASVNYLYFVAMDERRHQFSATFADHAAAVAKYRLTRAR